MFPIPHTSVAQKLSSLLVATRAGNRSLCVMEIKDAEVMSCDSHDEQEGEEGPPLPPEPMPLKQVNAHAFHRNMPPHFLAPNQSSGDGSNQVPLVTEFAHRKAREILRLAHSIQLNESMFNEKEQQQELLEGDDDEDVDNVGGQDSDDDEDDNNVIMVALIKKCARLQSQFSSLESLKYSGMTQHELSQMVLHLLRLVTATTIATKTKTIIQYDDVGGIKKLVTPAATDPTTSPGAALQVDKVHESFHKRKTDNGVASPTDDNDTNKQIEDHPFCLPVPARESLLSLLVSILSNKGPLRSVSNAAIILPQHQYQEHLRSQSKQPQQRWLLVLQWRALFRMLLRTAPYLDERKVGKAPTASHSRLSNIQKRTVLLIRHARHFFDQGLTAALNDQTAVEIWNLVRSDILFQSHTHACYRGLILYYLFAPSRCSTEYYLKVIPEWIEGWTSVDRCPEMDSLWLVLFCRARKYLPPTTTTTIHNNNDKNSMNYDWGPIRRRLLTHCQYWLQLPIGGVSMDKSFPSVSPPRVRQCPARLKAFVGSSGSYQDGINFIIKVSKLLVTSIGTTSSFTSETTASIANSPSEDHSPSTSSVSPSISEGTKDILRFLSFVAPYFNPSNVGSWTFTLGAFLHYFAYELTCRVGVTAAMNAMNQENPSLALAMQQAEPYLAYIAIPPHELVSLLHALLPLCQQALYSKNSHVSRGGESAMVYLAQLDPVHVTPSIMDFAMRALDISAVNLSHQAPAALSALTRLVQPALRTDPSIILIRLPDILRLTLAGIDSNDQNKTIRTLILYRSLASWIPVGKINDYSRLLVLKQNDQEDAMVDGTRRVGNSLMDHLKAIPRSEEYQQALERLPESTLLNSSHGVADEMQRSLMFDEAASAFSDWVLEFLDRIFALLRATGEREKEGKTSSRVANHHSTADVHQARNFSRVLKECLSQVFASMDDTVHKLATRSVARFIQEESLPSAAKDASFLCEAVAAARTVYNPLQNLEVVTSPGLDALIPILTNDLHRGSTSMIIYRLRCLAGAVRSAASAVITYREAVSKTIAFALASQDKHVFKTGCKILRQTLSTVTESYPLHLNFRPTIFQDGTNTDQIVLGRSAQLSGDSVSWHVPDSDQIEFAFDLLDQFVLKNINKLNRKSGIDCPDLAGVAQMGEQAATNAEAVQLDVAEVRRCLRVVRYSIRGGASVLLDQENYWSESTQIKEDSLSLIPTEIATHHLLANLPGATKESLMRVRATIAVFLIALSSAVASEEMQDSTAGRTTSPDETGTIEERSQSLTLSSDVKVCKQLTEIATLLLTRRGAAFRSQEAMAIWKAQKQLVSNFFVCAEGDHLTESLQRASLYGDSNVILYKDGEDAGKTISRRLLVTRVHLFYASLQRNASFDIPRRLRRMEKASQISRNVLFRYKSNVSDHIAGLANPHLSKPHNVLDLYEGLVDSLVSLSCHSNTRVRGSGVGGVDYAMTRFGWMVSPRVPRLLAAVELKDERMNGKFGVPSCAMLTGCFDGQGKRKRMSEAIKGICSILAISRAAREHLWSGKSRLRFIKTMCETEKLITMIPTEEVQKIVHYLQMIFSPFRYKFFSLLLVTTAEKSVHREKLHYLMDSLCEPDEGIQEDPGDNVAAHWKKRLLIGWFLTALVNQDDVMAYDELSSRLFSTCFQVIEKENGQPLQRVALGLLGRMVSFSQGAGSVACLNDRMQDEALCRVFGLCLAYDHREDTSVGGGHDAQWSSGVEEILRDATRNIALRALSPFQRTTQSSGVFKIAHAQLVESLLLLLDRPAADVSARHLLVLAKELAGSSPSEDQRNRQVTSAELFGGVCRAQLSFYNGKESSAIWTTMLLPFLEEVIPKIPASLSGAYFDAFRFGIQFYPACTYYSLTNWITEKIQLSLWRPKSSESESNEDGDRNGLALGLDGFASQSKWLYLMTAVLIELDGEVDEKSSFAWQWQYLLSTDAYGYSAFDQSRHTPLTIDWSSRTLIVNKLLPKLLVGFGHPYESCRDHIAGCLYRICTFHRKLRRGQHSNRKISNGDSVSIDLTHFIVGKLASLLDPGTLSFEDKFNSLLTVRRFFSYCIHLGEAKHEFCNFIIPLLPVAFESLKWKLDEERVVSDDASYRALETEVVKGFRFAVAEASMAAVISNSTDIKRVLKVVQAASNHKFWEVRHASAHFLRCFQGSLKFLFNKNHAETTTMIVTSLLADERREVSSAAMAALTGILAASPLEIVTRLVRRYVLIANRSTMRKKKRLPSSGMENELLDPSTLEMENRRARNQQISVFFLCAAVLAQPYDTPPYVPEALAAISRHSFERSAALGVRETVKKSCAEYKRTHMSDNWEQHRNAFNQEQLEALEDVVSSPHYYA